MATKNRQIVLAARPEGIPKPSDFRLVETDAPQPAKGQFLVRINYLSVDPYMRGLIRGVPTYRDPIGIGERMIGDTVGTVVESRHPDYRKGDVVAGFWGWREYAVSDGADVRRFDTALAPMSTAVGCLGMPGMTAYFGLLEIGRPKRGETVFISGAAGAVGSLVGQIAKIQGCRVVGSAGSEEKIDWLTGDLGFDAAFNYKDYPDCDALAKYLKELCPDGVDVFFDNTGGPVCDAVFRRLNTGGRVVVCGQIDQYNATDKVTGPRLLWHLIVKQARAEGFLVFQFKERYPEGVGRMAEWIREGKLKYRETITDGIENAPAAFIGLFSGANIGKQVVRVAAE